ncbi:MAG: arylsulfotransferase family protein [bacterium]
MKTFLLLNLLLIIGTHPADSIASPDNVQQPVHQNEILQQLEETYSMDDDLIQQLEALGYLGGHEIATQTGGVLKYQPANAQSGYNLIVSGHGPEVDLMDMDGTILHTWRCPRNEAFLSNDDKSISSEKARSFRRAKVLPNGDLIGIYNGTGMVRLNWNSEIIWTQPAKCHHDLTICPEGYLYTFVQKRRKYESFNPNDYIYDEEIVKLDAQTGKIISRLSLIEAFTFSRYTPYLKKIPSSGDIFHANTISYIDDKTAQLLPIYLPGTLLISIRNMDAIAIVDPNAKRVKWALTGLWSFQHEPSILPNGHILLFDNTGHDGRSKVIEFNPTTQKTIWTYSDSVKTPLFSSTSGACYRLSNGNTLIVESNRGRVIETNSDLDSVWEYINVHRWGEENQLIATLFDVQRIPKDFFDPAITRILNNRNSDTFHIR